MICASSLVLSGCQDLRRLAVGFFTFEEEVNAAADENGIEASYENRLHAGDTVKVKMRKVADGFKRITDMQPVPGSPGTLIVLRKGGQAYELTLSDGTSSELFAVDVRTASEQGLLGLAFHPRFETNRKFYVNYIPKAGGEDRTRIAEWIWPKDEPPREKRVLLEVEQPYQNHNAGQLAFGPNGYLYIGLGDGGWADDPDDNGQDLKTLLGSMLRIDVDSSSEGRPYGIPETNPFKNRRDARPEIFAYGLRNPWRYSFDPKGRLIVADVGQNRFEEVDIVVRGGNYGWNVREGFQCFEPEEGCRSEGLEPPILVYGRKAGQSITGGYVYQGSAVPALKGQYIYGDFGSGRIWAVDLPKKPDEKVAKDEIAFLGDWPLAISTFGRDHEGEVYVGSYNRGVIYKLVKP